MTIFTYCFLFFLLNLRHRLGPVYSERNGRLLFEDFNARLFLDIFLLSRPITTGFKTTFASIQSECCFADRRRLP